MTARTSPALCVCLLVLLAGCNGFLPGPGPTETSAPSQHADYPPGLALNGVASPERLASAQSAVLSNASFAATQTQTVRVDGHVVGEMNATRRAGPGGEVVSSPRGGGVSSTGRRSRSTPSGRTPRPRSRESSVTATSRTAAARWSPCDPRGATGCTGPSGST